MKTFFKILLNESKKIWYINIFVLLAGIFTVVVGIIAKDFKTILIGLFELYIVIDWAHNTISTNKLIIRTVAVMKYVKLSYKKYYTPDKFNKKDEKELKTCEYMIDFKPLIKEYMEEFNEAYIFSNKNNKDDRLDEMKVL